MPFQPEFVEFENVLQSWGTIHAFDPLNAGPAQRLNPRLVLGQAAAQRRAAFTDLLNQYLNAITAKTHIESSAYVANTRRMLDLTMRIVHLDVPLPTTPTPSPSPSPSPTPPPDGTPVPGTKRDNLPLVDG
jgi:hypothetical protein